MKIFNFWDLLIELDTNIEDPRLRIPIPAVGRPINNISLDDISRASRSNNATTFIERFNVQSNNSVRISQTISLEERMMQYHERFDKATDSVRARMLHEIDNELNMLDKECEPVEDPPEMHGRRRTYGQGGSRRQTAAEIAERELQQNDKQTSTRRIQQQSLVSEIEIVDLTSLPSTPQRPQQSSGPVVMTFSSSGAVIRQSHPATNRSAVSALQTRTQPITGISASQEQELDPDIILLESWTAENIHSEAQAHNNAPGNASRPSSYSQINLPPQTSPSRPQRQYKRRSIYQGELVQPRKRVRRGN